MGHRSDFTRRAFVASTLTSMYGLAYPGVAHRLGVGSNQLTEWTLHEMIRMLRDRKVSSVELVQAHLDRIEQVNPRLNAVVTLRAEQALAEARQADQRRSSTPSTGILHGIPMTIKDSLDTAGTRTTSGTPGRANHVPDADATVVRRLREAGAILLGKSNTPEVTLSDETDNPVFGRTNNPYDVTRSPGGSSGGAAAIVAAAGSPFDIGSDTGGSIRNPSHFCGLAGLKPTSGRVPRTGHAVSWDGLVQSFTTLGPIARSVADLDLLLRVIAGSDGIDPHTVDVPLRAPADVQVRQLRVAVYTDNGIRPAGPEVARVVGKAASWLREAGASVEPAQPEELARSYRLYWQAFIGDGGAQFARLLDRHGTGDSPLRASLASGPAKTSAELTAIIEEMDAVRSSMLRFLTRYDIILGPVAITPAFPHGDSKREGFDLDISNVYPFNFTGWPAGTVRCGTSSDGLPIGVQIAAGPWREDRLIAVLSELERRSGGWRLG